LQSRPFEDYSFEVNDLSQRQRNVLIGLCLVLATAAVYWPVRHFNFVGYDDGEYVYGNPHVQPGLTFRGVVWAFTTDYARNWHPLTWLSHMLDCQLFGLDAGAHHLVSVLIHIASTLLLFLLLKRMTAAPWRSAFVAALFALHPLHVESVAWVAERKDVLSAFFWMLTLWAYVRYVEKFEVQSSKFKIHYVLSLLFFTLGLMVKPMLVTLPFVLLLLDYWPLGRTGCAEAATGENTKTPSSQLLKEKLPFVALAAASCAATYWAQHAGGTMASLKSVSPGMRIANALLSYVSYLDKAVWPTGLAVFYPLRTSLPAAAAVAAGIGLVGVTAAVIWKGRPMPWLVTGWFWYLGTLVPVIGLVQVGAQAMADRYTYVPLIGLLMMLCWSVPGVALEQRILKAITSGAAVAVLAACAMLSKIQVGYWKDTETLFRHALSVTRDNWLAHNNLGVALVQAGRVPEGIEHLEQALRINPDYDEGHYNLGLALAQTGRVQEAMEHWKQALRFNPDLAEAHYNLAVALEQEGHLEEAIRHYEQTVRINPDFVQAQGNLGLALLQLGGAQEAIRHFEQALRIEPDSPELQYNLGLALAQVGRVREAVGLWEQAVRLKPDFAEAHHKLGDVLLLVGKPQEAIRHYEIALQVRPNLVQVQCSLGTALEQAGRLPEAIGHYQRALQIEPNYFEAHNNLASALEQMGRRTEAIEHYQQAIRIKPDYAEAHYNLGNALMGVNQVPEAIEHYQQAVRIKPDYADAHNNLGNALMGAGHEQEAIEQFEQALRIKPDFAEAHYNLGNALMRAGQKQEAIEQFEQALRIKPDFAEARYNLNQARANAAR
jgi:tetratricopeptide (TPR) repeat protein